MMTSARIVATYDVMLAFTAILRHSYTFPHHSLTNVSYHKRLLPFSKQLLWGSQRRDMHEHADEPLKTARRLFIVQPRQHSQQLLRAKLEEALRLAEALGGPRPDTAKGSIGKGGHGSPHLNPWVIVQQPQGSAGKWAPSRQPRAGAMISLFYIFYSPFI